MMLPSGYVEISDSLGIRLDQINVGSREVAFPRDVALDALRQLDETSIAVLGGDVLRLSDGRLEYVYANWYCNRLEHEVSRSYAERSRREAASYVENFHGVGGFEPLFVFVLSETT
jgi:hypothetical protein